MTAPPPALATYARHVNPTLERRLVSRDHARLFVRARDVSVWDEEGRELLDFHAGAGAMSLGHAHPRVVARVRAMLEAPGEGESLGALGPSIHAGELGRQLATMVGAPLEVATFASDGAAAIDAAIRLARAATGRAGLVCCREGFHGLGLGALSIAGSTRVREPFTPLLDDCEEVPFGELAALEEKLGKRRVAAFVVEPVQVEGGVRLAPDGYLRRVHELCRRAGTLLVVDESRTALGRTGSMIACAHEEVVPDVLVFGEGLGGGVVPIAAMLTTREHFLKAYGASGREGLASGASAGHGLACVAALECLRVVTEERLAERAKERGARLLKGLRDRLEGHPLVRDVRGRGLLVGIELGATAEGGLLDRLTTSFTSVVSKRVFGQWLALRLLERGVVCQPSLLHPDVLKLEPPLTVSELAIDRVVSTVGELLGGYRDLGALLKDVGERLGKQLFKG